MVNILEQEVSCTNSRRCEEKRTISGTLWQPWQITCAYLHRASRCAKSTRTRYSALPDFEAMRSVFHESFASFSPWLAYELANWRATKTGASALACELQRQEATLILGNAIPRIRDEIAGCQPVTIHDGILCQSRFASQVKKEDRRRGIRSYVCRSRLGENQNGAFACFRISVRT